MKPNSSFEGFASGTASIFQEFWTARATEWASYSESERNTISNYLFGQIFGAHITDEDEEYEMQRAFNEQKQQEISARASRMEGNQKGQVSDGEKSEGHETGKSGDEGDNDNE